MLFHERNYLNCNKGCITLMGNPYKIRRRLDDPVFSCYNRRYGVHAAQQFILPEIQKILCSCNITIINFIPSKLIVNAGCYIHPALANIHILL